METSFIDSHAHLADEAFAGDRDEVIARARVAGAAAIVCIGASVEQARQAARIAQANPGFVAYTAGVHPHDARDFDPARDGDALAELLARGAVAVGECGLDYHYDSSPRDLQRRAFAAQLDLARRFRLPVVVHTRDAEDDTRAMVEEAGREGIRGVLHCFTGSATLAETALTAGWHISFSGIVTFKKWADETVVRMVPDDRLLVESDAPYLAPVPFRGKRNEPAWVALTADRIAAARGVSPAQLRAQITRNAKALFSLYVAEARSH
ncbi:MAG: TatD family hydrolase [Gemmatimonadaceae bacterium]